LQGMHPRTHQAKDNCGQKIYHDQREIKSPGD